MCKSRRDKTWQSFVQKKGKTWVTLSASHLLNQTLERRKSQGMCPHPPIPDIIDDMYRELPFCWSFIRTWRIQFICFLFLIKHQAQRSLKSTVSYQFCNLFWLFSYFFVAILILLVQHALREGNGQTFACKISPIKEFPGKYFQEIIFTEVHSIFSQHGLPHFLNAYNPVYGTRSLRTRLLCQILNIFGIICKTTVKFSL